MQRKEIVWEMSRFKDKLLAAVGPELEALGYEYADDLEEQGKLFCFRKGLNDDTYAIITFQRSKHNPYGFYVNLDRCNRSSQSEYEALKTRLGWVICVVYYGWRRCPPDHDLRNATNEQDLTAQLADALQKLKAYGIPFLEDPNSKPPTPLRNWEMAQFRETVMKVASQQLGEAGFAVVESRQWTENTGCFGKQVFAGQGAFVVFVQTLTKLRLKPPSRIPESKHLPEVAT